ncbi:threonine--tRNA ligase [Picrophilus oshimae]|uniref:Threonine--tRNA ligase n=1 Tax=Picrophilus torridus (strain ATCC 700027 / DSM 9790 / JCM 10055 / NBRC 100828 / KAW 2/3) TaxID=1122961 RepID=A0A8G2FW15_PICTO|nr:threonine--tRNA ligase [Picrophilus oshimae]SMD30517.1 Ser-tRNA(Thr) hydrolase /threonyl-tRNA synthetase [Picrophilus oshimae DSM 9789]
MADIILKVTKGQKFSDLVPEKLNQRIVAARMNKRLFDLSDSVPEDGDAELIDVYSDDGLIILRHSAAHVLANAVVELYNALPNTSNENQEGFYYDFDMQPISTDDFPKIEDKMKDIIDKNIKIEKYTMKKDDILNLFKNNPYKIDKINKNADDDATVYREGDYYEFCRGPHVPSTGFIKAFKLLSIASTTYNGEINGKRMIRIYGTAFPDKKMLNDFLKNREEAMKRDHRRIGQEMDLFIFDTERAPGMPFYTPNGAVIRNELIKYMGEINARNNWQEVWTAHVFRDLIWKQSGHYDKYKNDMFLFQLENGEHYGLKPMNCPGHITIFQRGIYSYRDMPVKYCEPGTVYRYEKSGEMGGLTRPRGFTIDDGHGFLRQDQILEEVSSLLGMIHEVFNTILGNVEFSFDLSVMDKNSPENYLIEYKCRNCGNVFMLRAGSSKIECPKCSSKDLEMDFSMWDAATENLRKALESRNLNYKEYPGEAAFYGPKIDVHVKDALNRFWQLSTIQLDFFMPINFDLYYINSDGKKERPVIIHRAIYGSYERFIAILLEHYNGKLPTWLSPIQCYVIPVSENYNEYAESINSLFVKNNIRSKIDLSPETISKKIKMIRKMRPSYIIVVGEKEEHNKSVSIRNRKDKTIEMPVNEFIEKIKDEISSREINQMF